MAPEVSVVLVDNNSKDATLAAVRAVRTQLMVIANAENRGFAGAVNQGAKQAGAGQNASDFILLLNPDAILLTGLDQLVSASRQHGIAAGKLVDSTGETQRGFTIRRLPTAMTLIFESLGINRFWPSNPVNRRYRYLDRDLELPGPVEQPAGAFMMIRRDIWTQLGGLDEQFSPVWFEDVDFCKRAHQIGVPIEYIPQAVAQHEGGHSVLKMHSGERARRWYGSLLKYSQKHFRTLEFKGVCAAVAIGSLVRMLAAAIAPFFATSKERKLNSVADYMNILLRAVRCMLTGRIPASAEPATPERVTP